MPEGALLDSDPSSAGLHPVEHRAWEKPPPCRLQGRMAGSSQIRYRGGRTGRAALACLGEVECYLSRFKYRPKSASEAVHRSAVPTAVTAPSHIQPCGPSGTSP